MPALRARARAMLLMPVLILALWLGGGIGGRALKLQAAETSPARPVATPLASPAPAVPALPPVPHAVTVTVTWRQRLADAGVTGALQGALSVFGAAYAFERLFHLRRRYLAPAGLASRARELWREGRFAELEELGRERPSTLARAIAYLAAHRRASWQEVSEGCGELVSRELAVHHQRAYPLGIVASLGPLLGLLGMILGMIETFEIVAQAGSLGDPVQLVSGISEALVTTGLGLAIAIPFLAYYHICKYRTTQFGLVLEEELSALIEAGWRKREEAGAGVDVGAPRIAERPPVETLLEARA